MAARTTSARRAVARRSRRTPRSSSPRRPREVSEDELRRRIREDEKLLRRAEQALLQIKVAQGLSDHHASVLAAIRIRLKGDPGKKLEDVLSAAGDLGGPELEELMS